MVKVVVKVEQVERSGFRVKTFRVKAFRVKARRMVREIYVWKMLTISIEGARRG